MDGLKGVHAFGTAGFGILLLGFTFTFFQDLINSYQDTSIKTIIWVSYIVMNVLFILVVPALIVLHGTSNASVISALVGYGAYGVGIFATNILWYIVDAFISGGSDNSINFFTSFGQNSIPAQFLSLFFIIGLFLMCYIIPVLITIFPEVLDDRLAGINEAIS